MQKYFLSGNIDDVRIGLALLNREHKLSNDIDTFFVQMGFNIWKDQVTTEFTKSISTNANFKNPNYTKSIYLLLGYDKKDRVVKILESNAK
jgi:hypothetical protein